MIAAAPGKVVLSGAYAVLEGAPALVAAVDRYAIADSDRPADFVTHEVQAAIDQGDLPSAPWFDASELRSADGDRKLGLGSSAAILAASMGAVALASGAAEAEIVSDVFERARTAHRRAQGGGSGVDVAASCYGGVLCCELRGEQLWVRPHRLPAPCQVEVYSSDRAASTADMLAAVAQLRRERPSLVAGLLAASGDGARAARTATRAETLAEALRAQYRALCALGQAADVPIVAEAAVALGELAAREGASFGPAGAGGGDVSLFCGPRPSSGEFRARAAEAGLCLLPMRVGARGLHRRAG